ncbi:PBS lyase [Phytohabitans houttuyneae]|uniref:PBS lyase n=1 Tax=Phytohabitans houttuyneae TaxID=1076126 RepID=UPI001564CD07|nr:PBS lyase [Phytohabitans houttuyneae]
MFAGLDEIDWAAMKHAYGSAAEVPELLRGLVSDDPAVREAALDGMHGAVHHQGDVYACTLAAVPFLLEAAGDRALPGRGGVLKLLAGIGAAEEDDLDYEDDVEDEEDGEPVMFFRAARHAVAAGSPLFLELLADPDPEVRQAAPEALLTCRTDVGPLVEALRARLPLEGDAEARAAVVAAVGTFGRRSAAGQVTGLDATAVGTWLAEQANASADESYRLAALAELARTAPGALPEDVVATAVTLLRSVYAEGTPAKPEAGFETDTLAGAIRRMSEREAEGRRAPAAAELVRQLSVALGDRVDDRVRLLTELLRAPAWEARYDALRPASVLISGWRGPYQEIVALVGEQLLATEPRLNAVAAGALEHLDQLAAPAADALVRALEAAPREAPHTRDGGAPAWVTVWGSGLPSLGPTLSTLAALRDPRALPALRWAIERPEMPRDAGSAAGRYGAEVADLVPLIRRRLHDLPTVDGYDERRSGLVVALGRIGPAAAPALPDLLSRLPEQAALVAVGRLGPAAADAAPDLRRLLDHRDAATEIAAASALWQVTGDPDAVLPTLTRHLAAGGRVAAAAEAVAALGPAAEVLAPRLRKLAKARDANGWTSLHAAWALWRATGDADVAVPALTAAWTANVYVREPAARHLAEMGPAAAPAVPLIRAEVARRRRHTASDNGWSSDQVRSDEALLRACAAVLSAAGG